MKTILSAWVVSWVVLVAPAFADSVEISVQNLEKDHVQFIIAHHLDGAFDVAHATRQVITSPQGAPISLFFDLEGVDAYFASDDGSVVHSLIKSHSTYFGIPDGLQLSLAVSSGGLDIFALDRVYGIFDLNTLLADIKTVQSKEFQDTASALIKMLLCAQLDKLSANNSLPPLVSGLLVAALKPSCAE